MAKRQTHPIHHIGKNHPLSQITDTIDVPRQYKRGGKKSNSQQEYRQALSLFYYH